MPKRALLRDLVTRLRVDLAEPGVDAAGLLHARSASLQAQADTADAEWLKDRLADLGRDQGLNPSGARGWRREAAQGPIAQRLRPFYAEMIVERPFGKRHRLSLESALAALADGDGYMSWTWGYDPGDRIAWLSDSQPGCSEDDIDCAHEVFRGALEALGLELRTR
ncbi:MAG TPA: hypothetical protein VM555_11410 [Tahibacter sp.]|jgi:hypothetical protein|nr:hypothetical protein [Tahibacter sp.]